MRADRLQNIDRGIACVELCARGDDRVAAERERHVRNDPERVVDVEPVEHLLNRPPGPQLLRRPSIKRGAVLHPRCLDGLKVGLGAAVEHRGAGAQGVDD